MSKKVLLVEFTASGEPYMAVAKDGNRCSQYDLDFCRRDSELLAERYSGAYPPFEVCDKSDRWWVADDVPVTGVDLSLQMTSLPTEWPLEVIERAIDDEPEYGVTYCVACGDFFPKESACGHIFFCEKHGMWAGSDDDCGCVRE